MLDRTLAGTHGFYVTQEAQLCTLMKNTNFYGTGRKRTAKTIEGCPVSKQLLSPVVGTEMKYRAQCKRSQYTYLPKCNAHGKDNTAAKADGLEQCT